MGGGYVGVEVAGVFAALGSEVTQVLRGPNLLREFDPVLIEAAEEGFAAAGGVLIRNATPVSIAHGDPGLDVQFSDGQLLAGQDCVVWATGRSPVTSFIDPAAGVKLNAQGYVEVDDFQQTSHPDVFAIGDVTGRMTLTPVAIAAGRRFSDRLWGAWKAQALL